MSLLSVVQTACGELGITQPAQVVGSTDVAVQQLLALANRTGERLLARADWSLPIREATFVTVADKRQGDIATICPGFKYPIPNTMWDRSTRWPIGGPISPQEWQWDMAWTTAGPFYRFRIWQGGLWLFPAPPAGETVAFEYATTNWVLAADGITTRAAYEADTDNALVDEQLLIMGLRWRWRAAKGFDYSEEQAEFDGAVREAIARDGGKSTLALDAGSADFDPRMSVIAPPGSWHL